VEEQIQWVLSYVQEGSADVWKENILENLETREVEFELVEEFLLELKKKLGGGDEESVKVTELRKLEQRERTMEEFVQKSQRAARGSRYEGRALVEEFKKRMNGAIRGKIIDIERPPTSMDQWYEHATNLDRY